MGLFNRSKVPSADAVRLQGENHTTGYTFTAQINDLNAELREARAQIAAKDAALDALDEAHQITQQGLWQDITELRASCASLRETKDTFFRNAEAWETKCNAAWAERDSMEQEHQDFRLQNDAEWRAKLDHLKAQIAAKDAALNRIVAFVKSSAMRPYTMTERIEKIANAALAATAREDAMIEAAEVSAEKPTGDEVMGRYENLMDLNVVEPRTKRLRLEDKDGYTLGYQEWWLDEDGYPTHPVEADNERPGPA